MTTFVRGQGAAAPQWSIQPRTGRLGHDWPFPVQMGTLEAILSTISEKGDNRAGTWPPRRPHCFSLEPKGKLAKHHKLFATYDVKGILTISATIDIQTEGREISKWLYLAVNSLNRMLTFVASYISVSFLSRVIVTVEVKLCFACLSGKAKWQSCEWSWLWGIHIFCYKPWRLISRTDTCMKTTTLLLTCSTFTFAVWS